MSDIEQTPLRLNRRAVLRAAAALAATPVLLGVLPDGSTAAENARSVASGGGSSLDLPLMHQKRTLGRGTYSLEVSALGFGVMGATYNRGITPDRKTLRECPA